MKYNAGKLSSSAKEAPKRGVGQSVAGSIERMLVGFMSGLCTLFAVTPESLKQPGDRGNAPPSSGGISSLG